jgi:CHAT domain-containing protein
MRTGRAAAAWLCAVTVTLRAQTAEDHMSAAGAALTAGRPWDARIELAGALRKFEERNDPGAQAAAQLLLGLAEVTLGNTDAARAALEEATRRLRAQNDAIGAWIGLVNLARLEQGLGLFTAALARQSEALAVIEAAKTSPVPLSLETFVRIGPAFGLPAEALRLAPAQASYFKLIFLHYFCEPLTRDGNASLLIEVGQYDRAEEELRAAVSGAQMFAGLYEHTFAAHAGDLRFRQGRFDEAREQYRKALSGTLRLPLSFVPDQSIRLGIHKRMTELELATGHGNEALRWNSEALDVARNNPGNGLLELSFLEDRGLLLVRLNRFAEAEEVYAEAQRVAQETRNRSRQASIEANWGGLHLLAGNYGTAAFHMETAIELYQSLNQPVSEAMLWTTLAEVHILTGTEDTADRLLARARTLALTSRYSVTGDLISVLECWGQYRKEMVTADEVRDAFDRLAQNPQFAAIDAGRDLERVLRGVLSLEGPGDAVHPGAQPIPAVPALAPFTQAIEARRQLQHGNVPLARELWMKAFESSANREVRASSAASIGMTFWQEGNAASATQWLTSAAKVLEVTVGDLHADAMLTGFFGTERRAYYDVLVELLLHDARIAKAFEVTERARARAFLRLVGNHRLKPPAGIRSEVVTELETLRRTIAAREAAGESQQELRLRYEALLPRVQTLSAEYAAMTSVATLDLEAVREQLPAGATMISYYLSPLGAHAWILDAETLEHVRLPLNAAQLRRISCWADALGRTRSGRPAEEECGSDPAKADEAYAALIAPLRNRIRGTRLLLVPHGALHYVPFAALRDPETGRYLVEDLTIAYVPSASTIRFLRGKESPVNGRALVLGDPDTPGQPRLPGARAEAQRVAERFRVRARLGKEARSSLLRALGGRIDLVHIAAHASYDASAPLFSTIHLAPGDGGNGALTVAEIQAELDLTGVNLVVLSACRSGVGKRSHGDEVVGLTRAILYAGSPGVISTLWDINDAATPPLIEKFYDRLLAGAPAADALREAQVELLRDERYAAPYYWAAFLMTGAPAGHWQPSDR